MIAPLWRDQLGSLPLDLQRDGPLHCQDGKRMEPCLRDAIRYVVHMRRQYSAQGYLDQGHLLLSFPFHGDEIINAFGCLVFNAVLRPGVDRT